MDAAVAAKENSVLFVDDEPRVLTSMRAMFRRDYNVLVANSGDEAMAILRRHPVDVVVSDQRMPGMTGVEVLKEVKEIAPRTMRILLTGYADLNAIEGSINDAEVFRYLMKPCPSDDLKEAVALAANVANGVFDASQEATGPDPVGPASGSPVGEAHAAESGSAEGEAAALFELSGETTTATGRIDDDGAQARAALKPEEVEVLVLSRDQALMDSLNEALGKRRLLHHAAAIEDAMAMLESHPIGVLVTDTAVDEKEVAKLTAQLKAHVPELVTVIASDRSDAQALITMINYGQIFRFLLKPVQVTQCRLWLESAVNKHLELSRDPNQAGRHRVQRPRGVERSEEGFFGGMRDRFNRIRGRLFKTKQRMV